MPAAADAPSASPAPVQAQDFVASLPAPVLRLLILFAGPIVAVRGALEVLSWKPERRVESYLLVGAWWAACLGGQYAFMWLLPPLVFAPLFPLSRLRLGTGSRPPVHPTPAKPATTETLLATLGDLHKIYALLPPSPGAGIAQLYAHVRQQLGMRRLARGLLVLWAAWVLLGRALGLRVLAAVIGSGLLLLPSPALAHVVYLLGKSLFVRRLTALAFVIVFGSPDDARDYTLGSPIGWLRSKWAWSRRPAEAGLELTPTKVPEDEHAPADKAGNPIYFRFELFENQRWWMGLDWTSALLPQERPSWCDVHLLPVSPPMAFTLPPSSSIDVPAPTDTEPRAQVRRTATWRWIDDDWTVYKRTGDGATVSPARPAFDDDLTPAVTASPDKARPASVFGTSPDDDGGHARAPSMAEAAFAKGLGRLKNVASTATSTSPSRPAAVRGRTGSGSGSSDAEAPPPSLEDVLAGAAPAPVGQAADRNEPTDGDGWVYGDNRWENMGSKGGLGKFTRRRRWQRRAVCTETVHRIKELAATDATPTATPAPAAAASTTSLGHGSPDGATMQRTASGRAPFKPPTQPTEPSVVCKSVETRPPAAPAAAPIPTQAGASAVPTRDEQLRQRLKKAMGSMGA